jgi:hypothetical protein
MEQQNGFVGKWDYSPVMFWTEKCITCSVYSLLLTVICILTFRRNKYVSVTKYIPSECRGGSRGGGAPLKLEKI